MNVLYQIKCKTSEESGSAEVWDDLEDRLQEEGGNKLWSRLYEDSQFFQENIQQLEREHPNLPIRIYAEKRAKFAKREDFLAKFVERVMLPIGILQAGTLGYLLYKLCEMN